MLAYPGGELRWHVDQPQTRFNILFGHYDYVVLQQATHPFDGADALLRQAGRLLPWIREAGAVPVAYMTWAAKDSPEDQAELDAAFVRLAETEKLLLASAGRVWKAVREQLPDADLYFRDGRHASPLGSAIAAAAIFHAITGAALPGADAPYWTEKGAAGKLVAVVKAALEG
jgi:hypothetical protein